MEGNTQERERIVKKFGLAKIGISPATNRYEAYGKIHELINEDQPMMFLYYRNSFYGFNKGLRGYMFSPRGPYHYGPGFSSIWKQS